MMTRNTVWIVNQYATLIGEPGGARHLNLAGWMARQGIDCVVFGSTYSHRLRRRRVVGPNVTDVHYIAVKSLPYKDRVSVRALGLLAYPLSLGVHSLVHLVRYRQSPDAVVASSPQPFACLGGLIIARVLRASFVLEVRDIWPESLTQFAGLSHHHPLARLMQWTTNFLYRHADAVVGLMPGIAQHLSDRVGARAPAEVWHVPNGYHDVESPPPPRMMRRRFVLGYAGSIGEPNALHSLFDALQILDVPPREDLPMLEVRILGDGPQKGQLVARASQLSHILVTFPHPVPRSQVATFLEGSDALVLCWQDSALYEYGVSPNKLFDYFASARPVIHAITSPYDPVAAAGAGVSVPAMDPPALAQAIISVAQMDDGERRRMGMAGFDALKRDHVFERLADRYIRLLNMLSARRYTAVLDDARQDRGRASRRRRVVTPLPAPPRPDVKSPSEDD